MKPAIKPRTVEDINLYSNRTFISVKFENDPKWHPVTLSDLGGILKSMNLIDFYLENEQRVGIEQEYDMIRNRETGEYEVQTRTITQDIRDFLSGCSWKEYERIFASV